MARQAGDRITPGQARAGKRFAQKLDRATPSGRRRIVQHELAKSPNHGRVVTPQPITTRPRLLSPKAAAALRTGVVPLSRGVRTQLHLAANRDEFNRAKASADAEVRKVQREIGSLRRLTAKERARPYFEQRAATRIAQLEGLRPPAEDIWHGVGAEALRRLERPVTIPLRPAGRGYGPKSVTVSRLTAATLAPSLIGAGAAGAGIAGAVGSGVARQAIASGIRGGLSRSALYRAGASQAGVTGAGILGSTGGGAALVAALGTKPGRAATRGQARLATTPYHLARVAWDAPGRTASHTFRSFQRALIMLPVGVAYATVHPVGAVEMMKDDIVRRYGPLYRGDSAKFEQIASEEGLTPYFLDALMFTPASRVVGSVGRRGLLGPAFQSWLTRRRPDLLIGTRVKPQVRSKGVIGAAAQDFLDFARQHAQRAREARGKALVQTAEGQTAPLSRARGRLALRRETSAHVGRYSILEQIANKGLGKTLSKLARTLTPLQQKALRLAVILGLPADPIVAAEHLLRRKAAILANREARGVATPRFGDEVALIDELLENKYQVFTPELRAAADEVTRAGKRVAGFDPSLPLRGAALRAYLPQAIHLSHPQDESATIYHGTAADIEGTPDPRRGVLGDAVYHHGDAEAAGGYGPNVLAHQLAEGTRVADLDDPRNAALRKAVLAHPEDGARMMQIAGYDAATITAPGREGAAPRLVTAVYNPHVLQRAVPDLAFGGLDNINVEALQDLVARAVRKDPEAIATLREQFAAHEAARKEAGLHAPGYFPSQLVPRLRGTAKARGLGISTSRQYSADVFRIGAEDNGLAGLALALRANVRRRFSWERVATVLEAAIMPYGRGGTAGEVARAISNAGIDPDTVTLVHQAKLKANRVDEALIPDEALAKSLDSTKRYENDRGWAAVPKDVIDELMVEAVGKTNAFRWMKTKASRAILLTANLPWLQFQVISNLVLTGLGRTGPMDIVKAQIWWHKLSAVERERLAPFLGQGHFEQDVGRPRFFNREGGRFISGYRAWRAGPTGQRLAKANVLDWMFRADHEQNLIFRRAVLYSQIKRDAYRRMGASAGRVQTLQERVTNILKLGPAEQMRALERDTEALTKHAEHVNEFLGDYLNFTKQERRYLASNIMFYSFLRYSLRLVFYTMPVKHPTTTAILGKIGLMDPHETQAALGPGALPYQLGKFYSDGMKFAVDLSRANPALSTFTQSGSLPQIAAGVLPPYATLLLAQVFQVDAFKGKMIKLNRSAETRTPLSPFNFDERARVALRQLLTLYYPYRTAEKILSYGEPLGSDSLIFSPRPTKYKRGDVVQSIAASMERERARPLARRIGEEVLPFLPRPSDDKEIAASAAQKGSRKSKKRIFKPGPSSGGSSGFNLGGGSTGGTSGFSLGGP